VKRLLDKELKQNVDSHGIAIQGGGDVNLNIGLSYSEVKDVALTVFRENFPRLKGQAMELAAQRGSEITEDFLVKLQAENPTGIEQANTPDFQDALFTVQKEYAKAGDKELGQLLVDLLVDRTKTQGRSVLQIVLNESLHTAPKLTTEHLAILAVVFFFRYTKNIGIGSLSILAEHLNKHITNFSELLPSKDSSAFQHLQFTGCGSVSLGSTTLENVLKIVFRGLFSKGFDRSRLTELEVVLDNQDNFIIPCVNDSTKFQVRGIEIDSIKEWWISQNVNEENRMKLENLFNENLMSDQEIREKVIEVCPLMTSIFNAWDSTKLKSFELTSVGIAIGHANIKRNVGEFSDLSIWIN
jgi:hypothetical protein